MNEWDGPQQVPESRSRETSQAAVRGRKQASVVLKKLLEPVPTRRPTQSSSQTAQPQHPQQLGRHDPRTTPRPLDRPTAQARGFNHRRQNASQKKPDPN